MVGATGLQGIDFASSREAANAANQSAKLAGTFASKLYELANERAAVEGQRYQAENPITLKQIEDAKKQGKDLEDLMPGSWTTFDKAARSVAVDQVTTELEMAGRAEMSAMLNAVKSGQMSASDLMSVSEGSGSGKLGDLIDGYAAVVADMAPEAVAAFRARMSTLGNSVYQSAADFEIKQAKAQRTMRAEKDIEGFVRDILPGIIREGERTDPMTGEKITVDQIIDAYRNHYNTVGEQTMSVETARRIRDTFEKGVVEARKGAITEWGSAFEGGPGAALRRLKSGSIEDPAVQAAYDSLSDDEKMEVQKDIRAMRTAQLAEINAVDAAKERARRDANREGLDLFLKGREANDPLVMQSGIDMMVGDQRQKYEDYMRENPDGYETGQARSFHSLKRRITLQTNIAPNEHLMDIDASLRENKISEVEATQLTAMVAKARDEREQSVRTILQGKLGYNPQAPEYNESPEVKLRRGIYQNLISDLTFQMTMQPDLDPFAWMEQKLPEIERQETMRRMDEAITARDNSLDTLQRMGGFDSSALSEMSDGEIVGLLSNPDFKGQKNALRNYLTAVQSIRMYQKKIEALQ